MFRLLFSKMMFSNKVISQRNDKCLICESTTEHSGSLFLNGPLHHAARILIVNKQDAWQAAKQ